jgi:hypothetical protein
MVSEHNHRIRKITRIYRRRHEVEKRKKTVLIIINMGKRKRLQNINIC